VLIYQKEERFGPFAMLGNTKVAPMFDDKIICLHDSKGKFPVKSFCRKACEGSSNLALPTKTIRRPKAPTKACSLAWVATKGKVPTEDILKIRNFNLVSRCPTCL